MKDRAKYTPMMQQYLQVKEQYPDMLVFFRLGDFYELFFDDALKASKMLEITLTSRAGGKDAKIPMCGVPYHAAHNYIQKLVDRGEKVAIAEQTSQPTKGVSLVSREVTKIITPGTFVQEGTFAGETNSYVLALYEDKGTYSLAYGDISIGKYYYIQNVTSEQALLDQIRLVAPLEVVYLQQQAELFLGVVARVDCVKTEVENFTLTTREDVPVAAQLPFSLLTSYLNSVRSDSMISFQGLFEVAYDHTMYMNMSTLTSLELFETMKTRNKQGSLRSLLDQTKSVLGSRLLHAWLRAPRMDEATITTRLDVVEHFFAHYIERKKLQQILGGMYDIERLISRISAENAGIRELHQLKQTLLATDELTTFLTDVLFHPHIEQRMATLVDLGAIRDELVAALATEDVNTRNETGIFNRGYSAAFDALQELAAGGTTWLANLEQREKERTGIKHLRIKYNKVFGYFIEISKGSAQLVQPEWGYERKQTLTNAERFVTEELKEKEAQILGAKEQLLQLEKQLFLELCRKIAPYRIQLQKLADFVAWIDVLQSFAEISQEQRYTRPRLSRDGSLSLRASRHPIIERTLGEAFIANDVQLIDHHMLLITGPNMAGKSTYMRQIALAAIMHQIGCFVPADVAQMPLFDAIYTRIGAQDDLFAGESTFMVEMKEVSVALAEASAQSLLLFDEIGRGTATFDGLALAYAIFGYINQTIQAKTLFSTHYHELTEFTKTMPGVRNVHVSASLTGDDIIFHHRVQAGSIEHSYGVQVARLAQLPTKVVDEAQKLLLMLETNQTKLDESLVDEAKLDALTVLQREKEALVNEHVQTTSLLATVLAVDLDTLSPRDVVAKVEQLQNTIKTSKEHLGISPK